MPTQINRDVEDFSTDAANKLSLRLLNLVVKTAYYVLARERLIVLDKGPRIPNPARTRSL